MATVFQLLLLVLDKLPMEDWPFKIAFIIWNFILMCVCVYVRICMYVYISVVLVNQN